jgi:hypothetical protein
MKFKGIYTNSMFKWSENRIFYLIGLIMKNSGKMCHDTVTSIILFLYTVKPVLKGHLMEKAKQAL